MMKYQKAIAAKTIPATPPTTPPIIAPVLLLEGALVEDGDAGVAEGEDFDTPVVGAAVAIADAGAAETMFPST